MEQKGANRLVAEAVERGVNYLHVAPNYFEGEAEMKLGPALQPHKKKSFLACKTMERGAAGARKELEQSLLRAKTDCFDLYQFHAVSSLDDVERILAPGGAAGTFAKARQESKMRFIGASVHNVEASVSLKVMAHTTWPNRGHKVWSKCWDQPIDEPQLAELAVRSR